MGNWYLKEVGGGGHVKDQVAGYVASGVADGNVCEFGC